MIRRFSHPFVVVVLAAALVLPIAFTVVSTAAADYHWARNRSQFTLKVGDNVSGGWDRLLRRTLRDWNKNDAVTLDRVGGGTNPRECRPVTGRVEVCNSQYGTEKGWLGLTRLYFQNGHIEAATVQLNDSFLYAPGGRYNSNDARRHTICHEIGHTIGLDHGDTRSCMNDSQHAVFNYVVPIRKDFKRLKRIYSHRDGETTVESASVTSESFVAPTSLPDEPSDPDVTETVTVQTLDDGREVVTFILWAKD